MAWERANDATVPDGLCVLHHCDNPPCVNPAHLYVGTHKQNARDRKLRNRQVQGTRINTNKLTEAQVYEIRSALDAGDTQAAVGARYGITQRMAGLIGKRQSWAWLPEQ